MGFLGLFLQISTPKANTMPSLLGQKPNLQTITSATTISNATTLTVLSTSGATTITGFGTISLPEGYAVEWVADVGNTLSDVVITPAGTALVSYFN